MQSSTEKTIIVTGGAGFIGSALCRNLIQNTRNNVVVIDKLTYAANLAALSSIFESSRFQLYETDICDFDSVSRIVEIHAPDAIMHLAAESHVDRSISGSDVFIETNIIGTHNVLKAARSYWDILEPDKQSSFRFLHISTDEVFGSLGDDGKFSETSQYDPSSPYSASKAAADHLVSAWHRTFGLPSIIANCSNNFGPYQNREKLIPLTIINCLEDRPLPIYGNGKQVRDWIHVEDHVRALLMLLERGELGETYCVGSNSESANIDVVKQICQAVDDMSPSTYKREKLISFVTDRPGHDVRYAIDASKIRALGWKPEVNFEAGLRQTVFWFANNKEWWQVSK